MNGYDQFPSSGKSRLSLLKRLLAGLVKFFNKDKDRLLRRGEINLGDLAKALNNFPDASADEQELIANCLGFQLNRSSQSITPSTHFHPVKAA
jgi:hypothetical protein